ALSGWFQPTPTHGGRPGRPASAGIFHPVSTHAHARWATHGVDAVVVPVRVSTHAHARWATRCSRILPGTTACFNPRPRTVGDGPCTAQRFWSSGFNPRPRTVGDAAAPAAADDVARFQPTPTHGGRLFHGIGLPFSSLF